MHPHELFRQVREWVIRPFQVRIHAYMVPPALSASYVRLEMLLGVRHRLGIANATNSRPLPRVLRGVLLSVVSHLGLASWLISG